MRHIAWILLLVTGACLNAAEGRARREDQVGHFDQNGQRIDVDDGHAVVRNVSADELTLWANAPEIGVTIDIGTTTTRLRIDNVLADAQLIAADSQGNVIAVERPSPTESIWTITTTGPARFELRGPDALDLTPWRFIMFADVQEAIDRVDDVYAMMNSIEERVSS